MTQQLVATLSISLPIILLILLGRVLRRVRVIGEAGIADIKSLIVNAALPSVLFVAFLTIDFESRYLGLFIFMPIVLFGLLALGYLLGRLPGWRAPAPFLMTGFEFGMLGISLFGTAYGMDQVGVISVVGLPHELFIWFVFVTLIRVRYGQAGSVGETLRSFAGSPIIIAIVAGTALNIMGATNWLLETPGTAAVISGLELLGGIIAPLILIVIGYGTRLNPRGVLEAAPLVLVRMAVVITLGLTVVPAVVEGMLGLPVLFTHAVVTFLVLPPPFIVPLYVPQDRHEDQAYSNNVLSLATVASIAAFLIYVTITA